MNERPLANLNASLRFRVSWIVLLVSGLATLVFGVVVAVLRTSDEQYLRAIGAASIGMGLFGVMITLTAFRRRERWAYLSLWYYPVFWTAHLVGNLPPGKDHVHQVAFIVLSLLGLLLPRGEFFPRRPVDT
jgi:cbb3-type cytochrome oxidase subunit 1